MKLSIISWLLLIFFLSISCTTSQHFTSEKLDGKFLWENGNDVSESLVISADSTFAFSWRQGLINGVSNGKIKKVNNQFQLYSELREEIVKYKIEFLPLTKSEFFTIQVIDQDRNPMIGATCEAFDHGKWVDGKSSNQDGICKIEAQSLDSIVISYAGYHTAAFAFEKEAPSKSLIVKLKEQDYYHYFEGEPIQIINRNKIQFETFDTNKTFKRLKN